MLKFFKPIRGHGRGYFSYITESIINIHNVLLNYPNEKFTVYHDLSNITGYGTQNIYDVCFIQDKIDYSLNFDEYTNIEDVNHIATLRAYDSETFNEENLKSCESIIKNHFVLNDDMNRLFSSRHPQIDFQKTIGFHRRATDMVDVHEIPAIDLLTIFDVLEKEEFDNIFLMSDNINDLNKFKSRYGNRLITFDEFTTSNVDNKPFFNLSNSEDSIKNHIREIVFGAYTLGMTKKLICTQSNLSTFAIFSNAKLQYRRLNENSNYKK
jgi:hypothetical protein